MGFFKVLKYVVGGAAAVVAAPIVLPAAAAAAGAVAAGAAAAAGTVAAGAAAAGTAVAGSAIGSAAIGAAATAGTAIGSAAGAVGLTSIAAATGTTAGAAAVGTIAGSVAVGGAAGISAKNKIDEAKEIVEEIKKKYEDAKGEYDYCVEKTKKSLESLAKYKKDAAEDLRAFNDIFSKIKNPSRFDYTVSKDVDCSNLEKDIKFKDYNPITLEDFGKAVIKSYAGGQIAGVALGGGIATTITTAGTGTAMSALSGAAATNATMAALGGGTVASGGLGMAGGAIISQGLVFAPALAIGGILLNSKASEALEKAKEAASETDSVITKMNSAKGYMRRLGNAMNAMGKNIKNTRKQFSLLWEKIDKIVNVNKHLDASKMSLDEQIVFFAAVGLAKVLEIQIKKDFIKKGANEDNLTARDVVSNAEIDKCSYKNKTIINYKNLPDKSLDDVLERAYNVQV